MQSAASSELVPGMTRADSRPGMSAGLPNLAESLRQGEGAAIAEIFAQHLDAIYNYCYRRTGSWSAAEDLASAVFLEVWRNRRRVVDHEGSVLPWLYGVATNVCRNHTRSQRRQAGALSRLHLIDASAAAATDPLGNRTVDRIDADRRLKIALDRLAQLPVPDQDVFVLICWEELSYAEAAQALAIPIGTVRSRLARVRRQLRLADASPDPSGATDD